MAGQERAEAAGSRGRRGGGRRAGAARGAASAQPGAARPRGLDEVVVSTMQGDRRLEVRFGIREATALRWDAVLRSRTRWICSGDLRAEQGKRIAETLRTCCAGGAESLDALVEALAETLVVEVAGPAPSASEGSWADMPWEFAISALASDDRPPNHPALAVLRRIEGARRRTPPREPVATVLFVASAPGAIGEAFEFDAEQALVHSGLDPGRRFVVLRNPTLEELAGQVDRLKPDCIHFAGVDVHHGRRILELEPEASDPADGIYLADDEGLPAEIASEEIARALRRAGANLRLTSFNVYNSASRTAPMAVEAGSAAAIGFQDEVDDRLAELFFGELYLLWRHQGVLLREAFEGARQVLSDRRTRLRGSGVALWGADPWAIDASVDRRRAIQEIATAFRSGRRSTVASAGELRRPAEEIVGAVEARRRTARDDALRTAGLLEPARRATAAARAVRARQRPADRAAAPAAETFSLPRLEVAPSERLNYSMLHNQRPIFEHFWVQRPVGRASEKVRIEVALHLGAGESFAFRRTFELRDPVQDLREEIRLPLLSPLWWSIRESVHTTISIRAVRLAAAKGESDTEIYDRTFITSLLPVDEWKDSDEDRIWLPSFALPRDPSVLRVVESAQRYLMAFADDRGAGFDGYQSFDPETDDPWEGVDDQVRAIWYAIVHDHPLKYINPPPTFTAEAQRLRRPLETITGRRGTCIDLAMLFASCLEFVEIHPALFLIDGHAFPGYWRSEEAHGAFTLAATARPDRRRARIAKVDDPSWAIGHAHYPELRSAIDAGHLVPLETVTLTGGGSFQEALEEGQMNLRNPAEFHMMLDIALARRAGVTPLPMEGAGS